MIARPVPKCGMVVRPDLFSGPIETRGRKRMSLTREQERWAEALAVHRRHGESAPLFVAERIGALALAGDVAGIRRWRELAARLDQNGRASCRERVCQ